MNVTVYCGSSFGDNPRFSEAAYELGAWIARNGHALVYGGSAIGLMGVVAGAALEHGGSVTGVEPRFFIESGIAQHDLTELIEVDTMSERKAKMIELGDAFVALPGGTGTLEEIAEIMSRIRLGFTEAPCLLLNIDRFYDPQQLMVDRMLEQGFIGPREHDAIRFPRSVAEAVALLQR